MTSTARYIPTAFRPTEEQIRIQTAHDRIVIVEANAGAAKTTTLALRIGEVLALGIKPQEILALVFTREARDVLRRCLVEVGISQKLASLVRVDTFEGFSGAVLSDLEGGDIRQLDSPSEMRKHVVVAIERVSDKFRYKFDSLEISTHNIAVSQFLDVQLSSKARMALNQEWQDEEPEERATVAGITLTHLLCIEEYEHLRCGVSDEPKFRGPFDATYDLARYLTSRPEVRDALPACRIILCDELHDMNEAAFRILIALLEKGRSYFIGAGDRDQVIHATHGADARFLRDRFECHFPKVRRFPLTASYRHGPHLSLAMGKLKNKPSESGLEIKTDIVRLTYPDGDWGQGADRVVQAVRDWVDKHDSTESCAILIRDCHQSIAIENALRHEGIEYRCMGMKGYLQRDEILFMRGMLAIALGGLSAVQSMEVRKSIVEALVVFGDIDLSNIYDHDIDIDLRLDQQAALERTRTEIAERPELLNVFFSSALFKRGELGIRDRMIDAVEFLHSVPPDAPADEVLKAIWDQIRMDAIIKRVYVYPDESDVVLRSVDGFVKLAGESGLSLKEFSDSLGRMETDFTDRQTQHSRNPVILERVETSKGKEYGHVIMPFLEGGEFPRASADFANEENLFYVGATRARARLTLVHPLTPARQSVFIERMDIGLVLSAKIGKSISKKSTQVDKKERVDLNVPYGEKEQAKKLGARWDAVRKKWFIEADVPIEPFRRWIKSE